jgi:putative oxidoreductase
MTTIRRKSIAAWVLQVLLAALFTVQALMKLRGSPARISRFRGWDYPEHFYTVVGGAELLGAIALLVPRFARFRALLLMAVMAGACVTHLLHREPQLVTTCVLLILLAVVLYQRREGVATVK